MAKKMTQQEFIERAKEVHGNKYDYSKVEYKNSTIKVCIICPKHGEFWQVPYSHLNGNGCRKCKYDEYKEKRSKTLEEFINNARQIHGDKYDYSKVEYKNNRTKICIICPEHGEFWQTPHNHLKGQGCMKCKLKEQGKRLKYTTEKFIEKAYKVHGNKYDYSKVNYIDSHTKVCIICPEHGEFWQKPDNHLNGWGCKKCGLKISGEKQTLTTKEFIERAKEVHGDKYDYSKVEYKNYKTKICIICPKHGEFWQLPGNHLNGWGCSICSESHLEKEMRNYLLKNNIKFEEQKTFNWLKFQNNLYLDFYLPDYNIAIECQGEQHFRPVDFSGKNHKLAEKQFLLIQNRDKKKKTLCEENGIKVLYYTQKDKDNFKIIKE